MIAASTKDPEVIQVADFTGNTVTLIGSGDGNTLVKVSANDHMGIERDDSVNMMAREVEVLRMEHTCTDDLEGHYLTGHRVRVPFELELNDGNPLIGDGFYPVTDEPAGQITIDRTVREQEWMIIDTGNQAGVVSLRSDVDATRLDLAIVPPEAIDGGRPPLWCSKFGATRWFGSAVGFADSKRSADLSGHHGAIRGDPHAGDLHRPRCGGSCGGLE